MNILILTLTFNSFNIQIICHNIQTGNTFISTASGALVVGGVRDIVV